MNKQPAPASNEKRFNLRAGVMLGITLKIVSVFIFVGMSAVIKAADGVPVGQLIFFRSFFAMLPVLILLAYRRELVDGFKTSRPLGHVVRGLVGSIGMWLIFFALTRLPLPEAITINYATPLFIVVLSAVLLREKIRLFRWSAVLVGFAGVLIVMWPRLTVFSGNPADLGPETIGALAAITACVFSAMAMIMVRTLVQTERSATIVIYFSIVSACTGLLTIPFGWVPLSLPEAMMLIGAGVAGGIAQILLTESYRHAEMSTIAPFEYSSLLLSVALGFLIFGDIPTVEMLAGGVIVIGAGIFIIYREHLLGLDRARARKVSSPN